MKKLILSSMSMAAVVCFLNSTPAFAHEQHCHGKSADGKLTDLADAKDEASCKAKDGVWKHHHPHCHKAGKDVDQSTEKACKKAGGSWEDHGHNGLAE